ncbi:MAG: glycoside hydrolase family 28 protein [Bacteroidales bacterium]|nr:glycoside hydrolase family 28 protein [Bacteroidales bacterium]
MQRKTIYNILDFGAVGDGKTDNAIAIQKAVDTCSAKGGDIVLVPSGGVYMTGPFDLKSHVNFHVEANARVVANPDESVYTRSAFRGNYGEGSIWIGGEAAENVTISGSGTIDGNGVAFMGPEEKAAYALKPFDTFDRRPHLFTPVHFKNLTIRDITFKDSAYWCIHLVGCTDVFISSIKIYNNLKIRNSDGIDLDHSRNVHISDCYIESGDDCICLKTRREYQEFGPTENVTVKNCTLKSTSCSIKLGSENMDAIRDVTFSDCIILSSNRGIGIQNRDEGIVENIRFEDIAIQGRLFDDVWWGKAEPIYVTAYKRQPGNNKDANWRFAKGQIKGRVGKIRNIAFLDIRAVSENGIFVGGENEMISDIKFQNVKIEVGKTTRYRGGFYDLRPSVTVGLKKNDTAGFYIENAEHIELKNCRVMWGKQKEKYFGNALFAYQCKNLIVINFKGRAAFPERKKAMEFQQCEGISVR